MIPYGIPAVLVRNEEPDDRLAAVLERVLVVRLDDLACDPLITELGDLTSELVVEYEGEGYPATSDEVNPLGCFTQQFVSHLR